MLFGRYRPPPHSMGGGNGGTGGDLFLQGPSLPIGSPPLTTTSQPITEEDFWGLPQVQWGRIPLQVSLLGHEELKTPYRVKRGLSSILRKVCILLTLLPSGPDYIPVGIEVPVTTKSGFCRPAHDIHIFNGNKINYILIGSLKIYNMSNNRRNPRLIFLIVYLFFFRICSASIFFICWVYLVINALVDNWIQMCMLPSSSYKYFYFLLRVSIFWTSTKIIYISNFII